MKNIYCILICLLFANSTMAQQYTVDDGDSLRYGNDRIRLKGIDAPELFQQCKKISGEEYSCGQKSKKHLTKIIKNSHNVDCNCDEKRDRYNRKLCECFADNININSKMVEDGWAMSYLSDAYEKEENFAVEYKKGIWQGKFMRPALYRALKRSLKSDVK